MTVAVHQTVPVVVAVVMPISVVMPGCGLSFDLLATGGIFLCLVEIKGVGVHNL